MALSMAANPFTIFNDMEDRRAAQVAQAENAARPAFQHLTYTTDGVGQLIVKSALKFSAAFSSPPALLTGSVMTKLPGEGWAYPQITAGVYKWKVNAKGFVTGAFVYFNVRCDPLLPDADGTVRYLPADLQDEVAYLNERRATVMPFTTEAADIQARLRKAQMDLRRSKAAAEREEPKPKIVHHFLFQGTALKDLPANITEQITLLAT